MRPTPSLGCWALNEMISNAPEFLANLAAALYEEDPIYFDVKRLMSEAVKNYIEAEVRALSRIQ